MSKNKYSFQVSEENGGWKAEIIRRATSKRTVVSKAQTGFSTESEAGQWAEKELKSFLKILKERRQRRSQ